MLIPAMVVFLLTFAVPMILVGRLSLFASDYATTKFVGMQNYVTAIFDHYYVKSYENAFWFVLMIAPSIVIFAYTLSSVLSNYNKKTQSIARFVVYIPGLTSGIIMGLLWAWLLLRQGLINQILSVFNIQAIPFLSEQWPARISIAVISVISSIGGMVILFSASMHSISKELQDASMIDGANRRQYKKFIVRPMMLPTILLALLLNIVGIMQMWETIFVLTEGGGPEGSTASPVYEIFLTAFRFGKAGLAAAKGIILMFVIAGILVIKNRVEKWVK